jgi:predicted metal-dependent enzyme (double-stranded beta helix superfamily)
VSRPRFVLSGSTVAIHTEEHPVNSVNGTAVRSEHRTTLAAGRAPGLSRSELSALLRRTTADSDVWLPRLQLPDGDRRWWTQLSADERVDVWLLSWLPGQNTELHDHGSSAAAFSVVRGLLAEVRIDAGHRRVTVPRPAGSTVWLAPGVIHDMCGAGIGPAVSIHAYSPPLTRMTYYATDCTGLHTARTVQTNEPEQE